MRYKLQVRIGTMQYPNPNISYFARVDFRNDKRLVGLYQKDRIEGAMYLLGRTGSGKSHVMKLLLYQDIIHHRGALLIDVSGQLVQEVMALVPDKRKKDVILIDLADADLTIGYNPLRKTHPKYHSIQVSYIMDTFKKLWGQSGWGVRVEYLLRNILYTLLLQPQGSSFADIPEILINDDLRQRYVSNIESKDLLRFWNVEMPRLSKSDTIPVINKVSGFLSIPILRRILVENTDQLSLRKAMDTKKIVLVNIAKGNVGSDAGHLFASLMLGGIASAGFSRIDTPEEERVPFVVYLDEFHNYTSELLVSMISELRKFRIGYVFAHQYLGQLQPSIRDAVLGNVGTIVCFTLGADAKFMERLFYPVFSATDFINLGAFQVYVKLLICGRVTQGFSCRTITLKDLGYKNAYL